MEYLVIGLLVIASVYVWHNACKIIGKIFTDIENA